MNEKKIAGVLVEAQIRGGSVDALVIGIGLNVRSRAFPEHLADRATSLALEGADVPRALALAVVLAELGVALADFEARGLAARSRRSSRATPSAASASAPATSRAEGEGIDEHGRLLVRGDDGRLHHVTSGSVERPPYDDAITARAPSGDR